MDEIRGHSDQLLGVQIASAQVHLPGIKIVTYLSVHYVSLDLLTLLVNTHRQSCKWLLEGDP